MFMKEKEKQKKCEKEGEKGEEKKGGGERKRKKKRMRDSPNLSGSALSHFEGGFPRVLRKWILGFGGRKEGRQKGSIHESYRYERCFVLVFAFEVCSLVLGH